MSRNKSKYARNNRFKKEENNVILIVCCGETEELYFKKFNIDLGKIKIKTVTQPESPTSMIKYASRLMENNLYKQVWCVFDKDEFNDFDQAILLGQTIGINIAFSNQAFEYWFILHYERVNKSMNRSQYASILSKYMGRDYRKAKLDMYNFLKSNMKLAIENAKTIHQRYRKDGGVPSNWNSCTTVYELVEELIKWKIIS